MSTYGNEPHDPNRPPSGNPVPPPGGELPGPGPGHSQPGYGQPSYGQAGYGQPDHGQTPPPPPPGGHGGGGSGGGGGYDVTAAFSWAWSKFKQNAGATIGFTLLFLVVALVVSLIVGALTGGLGANTAMGTNSDGTIDWDSVFAATGASALSSLVSNFLTSVVGMVLSALLVRGALNVANGQGFTNVTQGIDWAQVLIAAVVVSIGVAVGILLCLLPGLVVGFLTMFTNYFIIDKNQSALDAIKSSFGLVKENVGAVLLFFLLAFVTVTLGLIACCVGIVVALPIVVLAQAYTYRTLQGEPVAP